MGTIDTILRGEQSIRDVSSRRAGNGSTFLRDAFCRLFGGAKIWACKRASRKILRDLTDVQLNDIGLTRGEATREVRKSFFWD